MTECQVDDMTGEALGWFLQDIIGREDILDAYYTQINMKKNRPGVLLTILSLPKYTDKIERFVLSHSTTFGVRTYQVKRNILQRKFLSYDTEWGVIKIKAGLQDGNIIKAIPEYEDVLLIAKKSGKKFQDIYSMAEVYATELLK